MAQPDLSTENAQLQVGHGNKIEINQMSKSRYKGYQTQETATAELLAQSNLEQDDGFKQESGWGISSIKNYESYCLRRGQYRENQKRGKMQSSINHEQSKKKMHTQQSQISRFRRLLSIKLNHKDHHPSLPKISSFIQTRNWNNHTIKTIDFSALAEKIDEISLDKQGCRLISQKNSNKSSNKNSSVTILQKKKVMDLQKRHGHQLKNIF